MKKSVYWTYSILGCILLAFGMAEIIGQIVRHEETLGAWTYTVGTWGWIMMMSAFLYKEIHSRN